MVAEFLCPYASKYCEKDSVCDSPCDSQCEVTCNGTIFEHWLCSVATRTLPRSWIEPDGYNVCLVLLDRLASERGVMEILTSKIQ